MPNQEFCTKTRFAQNSVFVQKRHLSIKVTFYINGGFLPAKQELF
jgi:hypothetical protein